MLNQDTCEDLRREFVAQNTAAVQSDDPARERERLEAKYGVGNVWNTDQLTEAFEVRSFLAPFCMVTRKSDGARGCVEFQDRPRFYFKFYAK